MKIVRKVMDVIFPHVPANPMAKLKGEELESMARASKENGGVHCSNEVSERLRELMKSSIDDMNYHKKIFIAQTLFLFVAMAGIVFDNIALMFGGFLIMLWWNAKGVGVHARIRQTVGFIDGIMFVLYRMNKDLNEATADPNVLRDVIREAQEDLKRAEEGT